MFRLYLSLENKNYILSTKKGALKKTPNLLRLDYIKIRMSGLLAPDVQESTIGTAQILEIFKVSGAGKVAGSKVTEGEITNTSNVRIIRDGTIIFTGKVGTLFREKNQVKQVSNGQECGITVKDYMDFQKNDTIEAFSITSTERSL